MKIPFEWEKISATNTGPTFRAKVFGGWIVHTNALMFNKFDELSEVNSSQVFIPDPNHEWEV